jgi:hypothetical protein
MTPEMTEPMTPSLVSVVGSCITRDNFNSRFNAEYKRFWTVGPSTNQSSMIALMSPPIDTEFEIVRGTVSDYHSWNIRNDLGREILGQLAETQPAYLIVDFFGDIHFGVARMEDGRYLTDNRWKVHRTDFYTALKDQGRLTRIGIQRDTEEYLVLWREAMDRFAAYVAEHCPDTTVIVHRGFNVATVAVPDQPRPIPLRQHKPTFPLNVRRANDLWAVLDQHCVDSYGWESIDLRREGYTSFAEHPWGSFYVHYTLDYYHRFMAELHKIHLRTTGVDADLWARILEIQDASREHGETRLAATQRIVEDQQRRIVELESLGIVRSVKFQLGQRLRRIRAAREQK